MMHTHNITTTNSPPNLGDLAEIVGNVSVQMMLIHHGGDCNTFQTAYHIHVMHKVLEHLQLLWTGIWLFTHTITTTDTDVSSDVGELAETLGVVSVQIMPLSYGWGCKTFQTAYHIHIIYIEGL